jgi:hypothetical protein
MTEIPKEWQPTNDWDSHRPVLWKALNEFPKHSFTEFGMGYGSTPLLQKHCFHLHSHENDQEWAEKFIEGMERFPTPARNGYYQGNIFVWIHDNHLDWRFYGQGDCSRPVVFIDCKPGEIRKDLIKKHADEAEVIIVHDTEPSAEYVYHMGEVLRSFKYRKDYSPEGMPWTTVVSNYVDVSKWEIPA